MKEVWDELTYLLRQTIAINIQRKFLRKVDDSVRRYEKAFSNAKDKQLEMYLLMHNYNEKYGKTFDEERWK